MQPTTSNKRQRRTKLALGFQVLIRGGFSKDMIGVITRGASVGANTPNSVRVPRLYSCERYNSDPLPAGYLPGGSSVKGVIGTVIRQR